jgi:hypothetical protein
MSAALLREMFETMALAAYCGLVQVLPLPSCG